MGFICNPFYAFVISPSDQCTFSFRPIEMITIDCGSLLLLLLLDWWRNVWSAWASNILEIWLLLLLLLPLLHH